MNIQDIKELKAKAHILNPVVRIGKAGITNSVVEEVKKLLKKRRLIKIKLLPSAIDSFGKQMLVDLLVDKTDSVLVQKVGFVVVLAKKR